MLRPPPTLAARRPRRPVAPPSPLALTAAAYSDGTITLTLTFGRAIDLGGVDPTRILVIDNDNIFRTYDAGGGTTQLSPTTVRFNLRDIGPASGSTTVLTALPGNGIVAIDNNAAWAGVSNLNLPFP